MTDNTELKRLAEAANAVTSDARVEMTIASEPGPNQAEIDAVTAFMGAATPAAVVALIADLDEARNGMKHSCAIRLKKEIERLKAELDCPFRLARHSKRLVEQLRAQAEQYDQALIKMAAERDQLRAELATERQRRWDGNESAALERDEDVRKLRAEIAGLKTGYEAYEQVNAELKAENERLERNRDMWKGQVERQAEELTALREEVTEWKDTVKFNEGCWSEERGTMIDKLQESRMRIKELDLLFGRHILAMRSALIEEEHGKGPAAAMEWIYNSLAGPGELPPEGETDSQAYFDREIVAVDNGMQDVMAFHEGRRAAMGKGEQS